MFASMFACEFFYVELLQFKFDESKNSIRLVLMMFVCDKKTTT